MMRSFNMTCLEHLNKNLRKEPGWTRYKDNESYVGLANNFVKLNGMDDSKLKEISIPSNKKSSDEAYYLYLKNLFDENKEDESEVLKKLKTVYAKKELIDFVFNPYKDDNRSFVSQKWHFYISYYGLKEYWGFIGEKYEWNRKKTYFRCPELVKWDNND